MFQIRDTKHKSDNGHQGYTLIEARGLTENYSAAIDKVEELVALSYNDDFLRVGVHPDDFADFTQATDGIDNDGDGQIDEAGETGYIVISWQVWENILHDQNIKSVRVTIASTANTVKGNDQRNINIDFFKANM
jgi:hypothetical protein